MILVPSASSKSTQDGPKPGQDGLRSTQDGSKTVLKSDFFDVKNRLDFGFVLASILDRFWGHLGGLWGTEIGHFWHLFFDDFSVSFQERPRAAQERPRAAQEPPKSAQERPKSAPRAAQERQETPGRAQDLPKSRPRPEKIDVDKPDVFSIDFGRVRTSFWKGFR